MPDSLGIDLSDLIPRLAVVDAGGQVTSRAEAPAGAAADANAIREATRRALAGARGPVAAIGVALPSAFDKLPSEIGTALREATSRDMDIVPVAAGTAAAIAEQWIGAARGIRQVIALSIAEHVIAGVVIDGVPLAGTHGLAASASWLAMNPVEREDYRRLGGLEAEV